MSTREERINRLQVALVRSMNPPETTEGRSDQELLVNYRESSRPLAEALHDVLAELVQETK